MYLSTLADWLSWIDKTHSTDIDLGLERIRVVAERLGVLSPACPVIIVAGTNGKGSTVTTLESIYQAANYRTGTFTSPYLFKINEQVRINHDMVSDQALCDAFAQVETARESTPLTSFEFFTLAAFVIFKEHLLDVMILEVGLGGRLDAVNLIDANVAIVTSIDIDHVNWLGHTREQIGFEKAGIFRPEKPAVCGDFNPPNRLLEHAVSLSAPLYVQGREFDFFEKKTGWSWQFDNKHYDHLPLNDLKTQNMSTVLMAVTLLQTQLPVSEEAIIQGLQSVELPGRIQMVPGPVTEIYDVSHNPHAISYLKERLALFPKTGKKHAVFSMLMDKDIMASIESIKEDIDEWYVAPLTVKRAAALSVLQKAFDDAGVQSVCFHEAIQKAYDDAKRQAQPNDMIVVFGSFHTVADVWSHTKNKPN